MMIAAKCEYLFKLFTIYHLSTDSLFVIEFLINLVRIACVWWILCSLAVILVEHLGIIDDEYCYQSLNFYAWILHYFPKKIVKIAIRNTSGQYNLVLDLQLLIFLRFKNTFLARFHTPR